MHVGRITRGSQYSYVYTSDTSIELPIDTQRGSRYDSHAILCAVDLSADYRRRSIKPKCSFPLESEYFWRVATVSSDAFIDNSNFGFFTFVGVQKLLECRAGKELVKHWADLVFEVRCWLKVWPILFGQTIRMIWCTGFPIDDFTKDGFVLRMYLLIEDFHVFKSDINGLISDKGSRLLIMNENVQ